MTVTRDWDTNEDPGDEQLTQFDVDYSGEGERPQFSPVAQPPMNDNIHWGTVRTGPGQPGDAAAGARQYPARRTTGIFRRLHEETRTRKGDHDRG